MCSCTLLPAFKMRTRSGYRQKPLLLAELARARRARIEPEQWTLLRRRKRPSPTVASDDVLITIAPQLRRSLPKRLGFESPK